MFLKHRYGVFKLINLKSDIFKDKSVCITGGTGSFGKKFVNYLLKNTNVKKVLIFSRDENKQYHLRLELNDKRVKFIIGDIRDREKVNFCLNGVDYIFHAAALKHVPTCENFPLEAVKTNIIGTENVIDGAIKNNVKKLIVLSTDKAAYPINAMGCSKMMMEKLIVSRSLETNNKTVICAVRYGNVLYSRGSILPLFIQQAKKNIPLTITDISMTRFLMRLDDAVNLILYSLKNGKSGDLFIYKAKSAKIVNLAKAVFKIIGKKEKIKIIGTRGGEKNHETLVTSEELTRSESHKNFWRIKPEFFLDKQYYFIKKLRKIKNISPFTSENATELNISEICKMLKNTDEVKRALTE